jgi:hypothetical protein
VRAPGKAEPSAPQAGPEATASPAETATPSRANLVVLVFDVLPVATAPLAQYEAEPKLAMWVPTEMREKYDDLPGTPMPVFKSPSEATARYSSFRKFTVTVEDLTATLPPESQDAPPEP